MTQYRDDYVRFLGDAFLTELLGLFEKGAHVALLGPPNSAKSLLLDELKEKAKKRRPIPLFWDNRMSPEHFLEHLSGQLSVEAPPSPVNASLSLTVENMMRKAAEREPIGIIVLDLLGFPTRIARSLLNALNACNREEDSLGDRLSAIVTGSSDFLHLSYGTNSPYRYAKKFVIYGLQETWARAFFCRLRMLQSGLTIPKSIQKVPLEGYIDDAGFDELYGQTGGYAHFIQEIGINAVRHSYRDGYQPLPKTWTIEDTQAILKRYRDTWMASDNTIRTLVRAVEHIPDAFNQLETLVSPNQTYLDEKNDPNILEVSGIARREKDGRLALASPLWASFLEKFLGNREKADAFAWQERWDAVWRLYAEDVEKHQWDRPISGTSRFRLREVINVWRRSLMHEVQREPKDVAQKFLNGLKYFYGFEEGGIGWIKGGKVQFFKEHILGKLTLSENLVSGEAKAFYEDDTAQYFLFQKRHYLFSLSKTSLPPPNEEYNPVLAVWKLGFESEVDSDEQKQLIEAIDNFWKVYHVARNNEYERNTGQIRERHKRALDAILSEMSKGNLGFLDILEKTADELVKTAEYYRVLISLVDPTGRFLHPAVSACKKTANDFQHPKTHPIDSDTLDTLPLDVQQWVVRHRLPIVVPDAKTFTKKGVYNNTEQAALIGIKAFVVIPMQLDQGKNLPNVIGTIHFERGDRSVPTDDEVSLMMFLSTQLAVFIEQKHRETLLEQALHAIDAPVRLINPHARSLFANAGAAEYFGEEKGWHSPPLEKCVFHYGKTKDCLCRQLLRTSENSITLHRIEESIAEKWDIGAIANVCYPLKIDEAAKGPIGLVERITDLRDLYELVEVFHQWVKEDEIRKTAQAILSYFEKTFPAGRIFLREAVGNDFLFRSLEQFGLEEQQHRDAFVEGKIILREELLERLKREGHIEDYLAIFELNPSQERPFEKIEPIFGLPCFAVREVPFAKELEKHKDEKWIEAALIVGERVVGKLVLRWPSHPEHLKWGLLRTTIAMAATAIDDDIRAAKELYEKSSMALNISYALRTRAASLEHYFYFLQRQAGSEHAALMEGMQKEIDFFCRAAVFSSRQFDSNLAANAIRVDLREIVQKVVDAAIDPRVQWTYPAQPVWIAANPDRIEELALELLTNAREFAPSEGQGGVVEVRVTTEDNQAVMEFIDNGDGIHASIRARLFEMYQCYPANRMGLGLSYVKKIAEAHGGRVEEVSGDRPGAHFVVRLPQESNN